MTSVSYRVFLINHNAVECQFHLIDNLQYKYKRWDPVDRKNRPIDKLMYT